MTPLYYNTLRSGRTQRVHCKWVGYHDGAAWAPIEAQFRNDGSAFVFDRGPILFQVPELATGTAVIEANNRFDIFGRQPITSPSMVFEVTPENVLPVAGRIDENNPSQVWYDDAWGDGLSLRYTVWHGRAPRVTREAVIDPARCPQGDLQASWLVRCENALTLIGGARPINPDGTDWTGAPGDTADIPESGAAIHAFDGHSPDPVRGSGFPAPRIWYWRDIDPTTGVGELVSQHSKVTATIVDASTIRLTKHVPQTLVDAAAAEGSLLLTDDVQTIYPDPGSSVTAGDFRYRITESAPGAPDAAMTQRIWDATVCDSAANDTSWSSNFVGVDTGPYLGGGLYEYYYQRLMFSFDLTALAGNSVDRADFSWNCAGSKQSAKITGCSPADPGSAVVGDWGTMQETSFGNVPSPLGRQTLTLNEDGRAYVESAMGGIVSLCARNQNDENGGAALSGAGGNKHRIYPADESGTSNDPYLQVTYSAAAAGGGVCRSQCSLGFGLSY